MRRAVKQTQVYSDVISLLLMLRKVYNIKPYNMETVSRPQITVTVSIHPIYGVTAKMLTNI